MLYLGTSATFLAMVIAGSRALIAESLQVVACFGFLAYFRPHEFGRITATIFAFSTISLILYSQLDLFKEGLDFLSLRFEEAANVEGTPIEAYFNRYWEILSAPYFYNKFTPLFGNHGLGSATRAGSTLAMKYGADFLSTGAEISWSRPILENGIIVGVLFIAWRIWMAFDLLKVCIKAINHGNYLAIFLFGAAGPILLFGLLGQPTNLGFAAFGGGLCLGCRSCQNVYLMPKTPKVLLLTNYRKDEQRSMLRFGELLSKEISPTHSSAMKSFPNHGCSPSHRLHPSKSGRPTSTSILFFPVD